MRISLITMMLADKDSCVHLAHVHNSIIVIRLILMRVSCAHSDSAADQGHQSR